jgi:FtsZ-binding cell division protein ZapB
MSLQAIQQHRMEVEQLKSTERDARAQLSQEVQAAEEKAIQLKNERDR